MALAGLFELQQFGIAGVEGVKTDVSVGLPYY